MVFSYISTSNKLLSKPQKYKFIISRLIIDCSVWIGAVVGGLVVLS